MFRVSGSSLGFIWSLGVRTISGLGFSKGLRLLLRVWGFGALLLMGYHKGSIEILWGHTVFAEGFYRGPMVSTPVRTLNPKENSLRPCHVSPPSPGSGYA